MQAVLPIVVAQRKLYQSTTAALDQVLQLQCTLMQQNDSLGFRQSQTEAAPRFPTAEERIKTMFLRFFAQAGPLIDNPHLQPVIAG